MNRLTQSVRHYANAAIGFVRLFLPLTATQLLWGLGAVAVIAPATAYAWWHRSTDDFSQTINNQHSQNMTLHTQQSTPTKIDTQLNADTNGPDSSSNSASGSQAQPGNNDQANVQVHINGQSVSLSPQGTIHKDITTQDGKTSVDISVNSATSGSSQSTSNTSMNIDMNSRTNSENADVN